MVSVEKKVIKGNTYLYLVIKAKVDGKVKRVWQKYLGSEAKFQQKAETMKLKLSASYEVTTLEFGFELALWQIAEELQLSQIIDEVTEKRSQGLAVSHYLLLTIINRCIEAKSKRKLSSWLERSYLKELLPSFDESYEDRISQAYTNHFQYLTEDNIQEIQQKLNERLQNTFNVQMDQLFYDPTNFFSYINPSETQELPRHGNSKEGRRLLNIIGLSVVCTNEGLPLLHNVYSGNVQDAAHFKTQHQLIIQHLRQMSINPSTVSMIFDKGNISQEAFVGIDQAGLQYICSVRPSSHKDLHHLAEADFEMITLANEKTLGIKEYRRFLHGKERRLIVCYDPKRNKWNGSTKLSKILKRIETVNDWFETKLNSHKWRSVENIEEKIKTIVGKAFLPFVTYQVQIAETGAIEYTIDVNREYLDMEMAKMGKSYLMTSHTINSMAGKDVVWLYRQQFNVEKVFSYLKDHPHAVKVRPVFHSKDSSIRGHIFSCLIGLLLLMLLHRKISGQFPHLEHDEIRDALEDIKIANIAFGKSDNNDVQSKVITNSKLSSQFFKILNLEPYIDLNV